MSQRKPSLKKGFTLVELLIVITIIGILAVALIPRIAQAPARARDVQRKADLGNIATALELFHSDKGEYPMLSGTSPSSVCLITTNSIATQIEGYLQGSIVPTDPSGLGGSSGCSAAGTYAYAVFPDESGGSGGDHYALMADLEVDTATGDSIYCTTSVVVTDNDAFSADLANYPCDGTGDAHYIVSR